MPYRSLAGAWRKTGPGFDLPAAGSVQWAGRAIRGRMKQAFAGFLTGIVVATCAAVAWRRHGPSQGVAARPTPAVDASAPNLRLEALRDAAAELRRRREAPKVPAGAASLPAPAPHPRTMFPLAAVLRDAFATANSRGRDRQNAERRLLILAGELAERYGVGQEAAQMSPEGLLALLLGLRETGAEPVSDEERATLDRIMAAYGDEWNAWLRRSAGVSELEKAWELLSMNLKAQQALFDAFPPAVAAEVAESFRQIPFTAGFTWTRQVEAVPGEEEIAIARQWAADLGLDAAAAAALRTVAAEYLRDLEASRRPGPPLPALSDDLPGIGAMVRAQKRIREIALLDEAQGRKLSAWRVVYEPHVGEVPAEGPR